MGFGLLKYISAVGRNKRSSLVFAVSAILIYLAASPELPAGFSRQTYRTRVEIEGVDFGSFDGVAGIEWGEMTAQPFDRTGDRVSQADGSEDGFVQRITLQRDFVTDPSLYLWAKNTMQERSGLKNVQLVMENSDGDEVARYLLKSCQPVAWSVEAAALSSGGFHETVELAVQGVEVE